MALDDDKPKKPRRSDYLSQSGFEDALSNWRSAMDRWRERYGGGRGGSTIYNRRARRGHVPTSGSGEADLHTGDGHFTQSYDDGHRLSRDTDGEGDENIHWTNQTVGKKNRQRHTPPEDARE